MQICWHGVRPVEEIAKAQLSGADCDLLRVGIIFARVCFASGIEVVVRCLHVWFVEYTQGGFGSSSSFIVFCSLIGDFSFEVVLGLFAILSPVLVLALECKLPISSPIKFGN